MWVTAEAVKGIPDLEQFNVSVDNQVLRIKAELNQLDEDTFFENMSETRVKRWENMLNITPLRSETLAERRFTIQSTVIDSLPYTYRTLVEALMTLIPDIEVLLSGKHIQVNVPSASRSMTGAIKDLLERRLPLDIIYDIIIIYNLYSLLSQFYNGELEAFTYDQLQNDKILKSYYKSYSTLYGILYGNLCNKNHGTIRTGD